MRNIREVNMRWFLKQLLPLNYETTYRQSSEKYFCRWRMWFGKCFNIKNM